MQKQYASALNFTGALNTDLGKNLAKKYCTLVSTRDFGNTVKIHHCLKGWQTLYIYSCSRGDLPLARAIGLIKPLCQLLSEI